MRPYSFLQKADDQSHPSGDHRKLNDAPLQPYQELGRTQTDSMRMALESPKTIKHHGCSPRSHRAPAEVAETEARRDDCSVDTSSGQSVDEVDIRDSLVCKDWDESIVSKPSNGRDEAYYRNEYSVSDELSVSSFITDIQSVLSGSLPSRVFDSHIPAQDRKYWSSLSVRVALAVKEANGSDRVAKKAANAILDEGEKEHPTLSLRKLATDVSMVVLEAGGNNEVAAAVTVAIMNSDEEEASISTTSSRKRESKKEAQRRKSGSPSKDTASMTPSLVKKRDDLKAKEAEIAQKAKALEEAERLAEEREKEINERIAILDAAESDFLESIDIDRVIQDRYEVLQRNQSNSERNSEQSKSANCDEDNKPTESSRLAQGKSRSDDAKALSHSTTVQKPSDPPKNRKQKTKKRTNLFTSLKKKPSLFRKKSQV